MRGIHFMSKILYVIVMCFILSSLPGCDKADEALKALDKAKTFKEEIDKKTKDVKDKVQSIIPGLTGGEKKPNGEDKEGSSEKEDD